MAPGEQPPRCNAGQRPVPYRLALWLHEAPRFWHALLALNIRKTAFKIGSRRHRSPCQHPSDSGRAAETGCDAIVQYGLRPERFCKICPLLKHYDGRGWRCSVDASDVRPFWGRVAARLAAGAGMVYLTGVLVVFGFLCAVGYPVHLRSVAWPPSWHELRQARAKYFFGKGQQALLKGNPAAALMSFAQSYELDPSDYSSGWLTAQLSVSSGMAYSNQVYSRLINDHPKRAEATSQAWLSLALAQGDVATVGELAHKRIADHSPNTGFWLRALIFACQRTKVLAPLAGLASNAELPEPLREVCRLELAIGTSDRPTAQRLLREKLSRPDLIREPLLSFRIERLLKLDDPGDALVQLEAFGRFMSPADKAMLALETGRQLGWKSYVLGGLEQILSHRASVADVELLCVFLIRHPDRDLVSRVAAALEKEPLKSKDDNWEAHEALLLATGAAGDWAQMHRIGAKLETIAGTPLPRLGLVEAYFQRDFRRSPLQQCLPVLISVPTEVVYATYGFFDARREVN